MPVTMKTRLAHLSDIKSYKLDYLALRVEFLCDLVRRACRERMATLKARCGDAALFFSLAPI